MLVRVNNFLFMLQSTYQHPEISPLPSGFFGSYVLRVQSSTESRWCLVHLQRNVVFHLQLNQILESFHSQICTCENDQLGCLLVLHQVELEQQNPLRRSSIPSVPVFEIFCKTYEFQCALDIGRFGFMEEEEMKAVNQLCKLTVDILQSLAIGLQGFNQLRRVIDRFLRHCLAKPFQE